MGKTFPHPPKKFKFLVLFLKLNQNVKKINFTKIRTLLPPPLKKILVLFLPIYKLQFNQNREKINLQQYKKI